MQEVEFFFSWQPDIAIYLQTPLFYGPGRGKTHSFALRASELTLRVLARDSGSLREGFWAKHEAPVMARVAGSADGVVNASAPCSAKAAAVHASATVDLDIFCLRVCVLECPECGVFFSQPAVSYDLSPVSQSLEHGLESLLFLVHIFLAHSSVRRSFRLSRL